MGSQLDGLQRKQGRDFHFAATCSAIGAVVAYPLLIAAKLMGYMPDQKWWQIALAPAIGFSLFLGSMRFAQQSDLRAARKRETLKSPDRSLDPDWC